jgi:hypothetical protein
MIDVWLKIRNRNDDNFCLKHLNFWLATFSNRDKYRLFIYNEDMNLPFVYSTYTIIKRQDLLNDRVCQNINATVNRTRMSDKWKKTCIALLAPYFYLENSEYVINIDADDIIMGPNTEYYTDAAIAAINQYNLPTLSYDYIYSYNIFDGNRNVVEKHWAFGVNISHTQRMRNDLSKIINNIDKYAGYFPRLNLQQECNLDILFTSFLQKEGHEYRYHTFISKNCFFYHSGFEDFSLYRCGYMNDNFNCEFRGKTIIKPLHPKTLLID